MSKISLSAVAEADLSGLDRVCNILNSIQHLRDLGFLSKLDLNPHTYEEMFQALDEKFGTCPINDIEHLKKCILSVEKIHTLLQPKHIAQRKTRQQTKKF